MSIRLSRGKRSIEERENGNGRPPLLHPFQRSRTFIIFFTVVILQSALIKGEEKKEKSTTP